MDNFGPENASCLHVLMRLWKDTYLLLRLGRCGSDRNFFMAWLYDELKLFLQERNILEAIYYTVYITPLSKWLLTKLVWKGEKEHLEMGLFDSYNVFKQETCKVRKNTNTF